MGDGSGGRSATLPTFLRSRSSRTRMERQKGHTVCAALDQRNWTGAPQLGQFATGWLMNFSCRMIGPFEASHLHRGRAELQLQLLLKIPIRAGTATEYIQTQRIVLRKGMARDVRFL